MGIQSNTPSLPAAVGMSDPQYLARRKAMFEFLTHVRALGADVELDIPAIAVIGWQSAGKSSLIEAISGITLPRASGTCTRCPTECQLTHSENPWSCTVSLQLNTAADGSVLPNPQKIPFGQPISEKSEVTERIRRAQRAILNPSTPSDVFLSVADTSTELSFSANRIVLNIAGPDVTDLNFIDLPGLFVGGEENEMRLIRDLAISYIEKPSCIILLTVACETDFVNQGAHRLAREYDPAGERTIGVLTKPDRIPATEEDNWLPYIRGKREDPTTWFCVKCPDSEAIKMGVTWEEARQDETIWFSRKAPWATLEEGFRQRLGTANLTRCLSDKLCDLIADRLPQIEQELNKLLERVKRDLDDLPPPPTSTPLSEVLRLITDFTREVERQGEGIPGCDGLLNQVKQPQDEFRIAIRRTAPCFVPQFRNRPASDRPVLMPVQPASTSACVVKAAEKHTRPPFLAGEEDRDEIGLNDGKKIFIDDVLQSAEWAVTRELPNTYPFIVQKEYIEDFVRKWHEPAHTLFKTTAELVKEATLSIVETHFGNYTHSRFKQRVSNIVIAHLERCSKETLNLMGLLLKVEMEPSTRNPNYFNDYHRKFLSFYKGLFHKDSNDYFVERVQGRMNQSSDFTRALDAIISNLPKIGFHNVTPLELGILQASEESENALEIMANVRAYFQVAFKRFVDNTVKAIDEELVLGTSKELQEALVSGLKLDSPDAHDACMKLVAEQPYTAEKRKNLVAAQKKLLHARDELYSVLS